ncbi:MAG: hypothetical protein ACREJQ_09100, partial [bacterium]
LYYPLITFSGFITQRWYLYPGLPFLLLGAAIGILRLSEMSWRRFALFAGLFFAVTFLALAEVSIIQYRAFAFDLEGMMLGPMAQIALMAGLMVAGRQARRPVLSFAAAGYLAIALVASFQGSYQAIRNYSDGYWATNAGIGKWIRDHRPGATVALGEIGYVGYYSNARIVDLVGLVQPDVLKVRMSGGLVGILERYQPDLLIFETRSGGNPAGSEFAKSPLFRARYKAVRTWSVEPLPTPGATIRELTVFERAPLGE